MPQLPKQPTPAIHPPQEFWHEFWRGVRESPAFVLAGIPFGLVTGLSAINAGLTFSTAYFAHFSIHAGASQLASYQLFAEGASALIIVLTVAIINVRFVMYSASLAPYWQKHPLWLRLVAAHVITDPAYAYAMQRYLDEDDDSPYIIWYFMGLALMGIMTWMVAGIIGIIVGAEASEMAANWSLDFAIILLFLGLLMPAIKDRASLLAALVGGSVAVLCHGLPYNLGLMLAAFLGIAAGYGLEQYTLKRKGKIDLNKGDSDREDSDRVDSDKGEDYA